MEEDEIEFMKYIKAKIKQVKLCIKKIGKYFILLIEFILLLKEIKCNSEMQYFFQIKKLK